MRFSLYNLNGKNKKFWVKELKNYFSNHIDENSILSQFKNNLVLVLHGSTTRNIEDNYSDLDLWLILNKDELDYFDSISEHRFIPFIINNKEAHLNPPYLTEFENCFHNKIDVTFINEIQDSEIIIDDLNEIKSNQKCFLGPENENNISQELRFIRNKLIRKANNIGIYDSWLEKWWRFIDKSKTGICNVKWCDH